MQRREGDVVSLSVTKILRLGQGNELAHLLSFSLAESYLYSVK